MSVAVAMLNVDSKKLNVMAEELRKPSVEQIQAEEIYRLREEKVLLEQQLNLVKQERVVLKRALESGISLIISAAYDEVNEEGKAKLDKYRFDVGKILRGSDIVGILTGEE